MKGSYYGEYDGPRVRRGRGPLMWVVDAVLTLITVLVAVVLALTLLVPYVNPARVWFFPLLGLAAPAVYVTGFVLMLYWIIRWRRGRALTMVVLVVLGLFKVPLFWRPELRREYGGESYERNTFKVMTYNVRNFYGEGGQSSVGNVVRLIEGVNPDVICLQEFNARLADEDDAFAEILERYESARFSRKQSSDGPLVILSKYRIIRSGVVLAPHTSVWADLLMGDDTVRLFNNHLYSTAIKASDSDYLTRHEFLADTAREDKFRSMADRFRENSVLRAAQVDSIVRVVGDVRTRRIVCGDFNDTPMSYVYRQMARELDDAFAECGSGYSHTFRGFFNTLRIDYVLRSAGFITRSYEVLPAECSDHLPVVVRLLKTSIND